MVRDGNNSAYGELWNRHSHAATASAKFYSNDFDPDDLVAEAFTKVYESLRRGGGPTASFRTYLQVTIKNTAHNWRKKRRSSLENNSEELHEGSAIAIDNSETWENRSLMGAAFRALPENWQQILWYTEILDLKPREVAVLMGVNPNNISALAYRAKEGLRQSWIKVHLNSRTIRPECEQTIQHLPAFITGKLTPRLTSKLRQHLRICETCTRTRAEAEEVAVQLNGSLVPLLLIGGLAQGFPLLYENVSAAASLSSGTVLSSPIVKASSFVQLTKIPISILLGGLLVTTAALLYSASGPAGTEPCPTNSNCPPQQIHKLDPPLFNFTSGTTFTSPDPALSGTAQPGSLVTLQLSGEHQPSQRIQTTTNTFGSWQVPETVLAQGHYTAQASQTKKGFSPSEETITTFLLDSTVQLSSPTITAVDTENGKFLPQVTGTGTPGSTIVVFLNGIASTGIVPATGIWSVTTTAGARIGENSLAAVLHESSRNEISSGPTIAPVTLRAPQLTLSREKGTTQLTVAADPGSSVSLWAGKNFSHRISDSSGLTRIEVYQNEEVTHNAVLPEGAVLPEAAVLPEGAVLPEAAVLPEGAVLPEAAKPSNGSPELQRRKSPPNQLSVTSQYTSDDGSRTGAAHQQTLHY